MKEKDGITIWPAPSWPVERLLGIVQRPPRVQVLPALKISPRVRDPELRIIELRIIELQITNYKKDTSSRGRERRDQCVSSGFVIIRYS
jgi:hypothetical protein